MKAAILSVGAFTPLGLDARQTALLVRAKKLVPSRAPLRDRHGAAIGTVRTRSLPDDRFGRDRMVALAAPAMREALRGHSAPDEPVILVLAVPERRGASAPLGPDFASRVAEAAGHVLDARATTVIAAGHAGFAAALVRATQLLDRPARGGGSPRVLVGAVDTYYDPDVLAALDAERRLHGAETVDGFIPSEGAAFALLGPADRADAALAVVRDVAVAAESTPDPETPAIATAGTALLRRVAAGFDGNVPWVLVDVNGERHRVKDWSFETIRNRDRIVPGETRIVRPAEELGDVGAATGAVYLVLAAVGFQLGHAPAREVLIGLHSEGGERGFIALEAP